MSLTLIAPLALLSFVIGLGLLLWFEWPPAAGAHLVFAVGVLPLILAAMTHFAPVLTRSPGVAGGTSLLSGFALGGGLWVFGALLWAPRGFVPGAVVAAGAAAVLAAWSWRLARGGFSRPHPCLHWYWAALLCLLLALAAISAAALWPQHYLPLKRAHVHLNLIGFVGLTAIGTLHVLVPTAGGFADPKAAERLRRGLPWALAGTFCVAAGAALFRPLAWAGAALWMVPLAGLAAMLWQARAAIWAAPASRLLGLAGLGYGALMAAGAGHGTGLFAPGGALGLYLLWFLAPLMTGATTHLLPVWWCGAEADRQQAPRARLGYGSFARAALFLGGGVVWALGHAWGLALGGTALLWYLVVVLGVALRLRQDA